MGARQEGRRRSRDASSAADGGLSPLPRRGYDPPAMRRRTLPLLAALLLAMAAACGHRGPVAGAPLVAVVTPSIPPQAVVRFRHRLRIHLESGTLERKAARRAGVARELAAAERAVLRRLGYRVVPGPEMHRAEAVLRRAERLDLAALRRSLGADRLLLTTVRRWEEAPVGGPPNRVVVTLEASLHDLHTGRLLWHGRLRAAEVETPTELQRGQADLARAAAAAALREVPPPGR